MTYGLIDGSSLFEVVSILERSERLDIYPLAWQCSIDITSALIGGQNLGILGTPGFERTPGPSGLILREVAGFAPRLKVDNSTRLVARQTVTEWATSQSGVEALREAIASIQPRADLPVLHPASKFEPWLEHVARSHWVQQNRALGGVFESWHVPSIAAF
jgi:hypothetical protein